MKGRDGLGRAGVIDLDRSADVFLTGWGSVAGPLRYSNSEVCEILSLPAEVASGVEEKIGTRGRHSCVDLVARRQVLGGAALGFGAAARALARAGLDASSVDAVIACSTLPDHFCPPYAVAIQKLLGVDRGLTFDQYGGCGAFAQAFFLAATLLVQGTAQTVLIVASEVLTRHLWNVGRAWEALAFGDGAAAMILSTGHEGPFRLRRCLIETTSDLGGCRDEIMEIPAVAEVPPPVTRGPQPIAGVPASSFADLYRILHRADVAARWGSHYMAEGIEAVCRDLVEPAEVYICPHQPSRVVLDKVRHRLGIGENRFASINAEFGNLSSASSPTAFCEKFDEGPAVAPYTVLAPVGTGLTYGAALLERVGAGRSFDSRTENSDLRLESPPMPLLHSEL
jgi:3-oxoacyl-[acyl-carrier-protein] synthase-3